MVKSMGNKEFNLDDLHGVSGVVITKENLESVIALIKKTKLSLYP